MRPHIRRLVLVAFILPGALSLVACDGPKGPQGELGPQGVEGAAGQNGEDGVAGSNGADGEDGAPGSDGTDGQDGTSIGDIEGVIMDAETRLAVVGATVTTVPETSAATTDAAGAFAIVDVPIGVYVVTVAATGYGSQSFPGTSVTAGQTATVDIELIVPQETTGAVSGTVTMRSSGDDAVAGAAVALVDGFALAGSDSNQPLEDLAALSPYTATTAADGSYTIENVVPGLYYVHVTPSVDDFDELLPGGDASRTSFAVDSGAVVTTDVELSQRPSSAATYRGSTTCLQCHNGAVAQTDMSGWMETLHSLIHREPGVATTNQDLSGYPNHDAALAFFRDGNARDNTGAGDQYGLRITQAEFPKFPANMNFLLGFDGRYFVVIENSATNVRSMRYYAEFTFGGHGIYKERWVTRVSTDDT